MNVDTGHLIYADKAPEGYKEIPLELADEVMRAMQGKQETYVNLKEKSPLSAWAKQQRKTKNKQSKESRKQNRGK